MTDSRTKPPAEQPSYKLADPVEFARNMAGVFEQAAAIGVDEVACLIDFGACREDIRQQSRKVSAIVKHGYSPPEQYTSRPELQGPWTDIYALAATLYRAIPGGASSTTTQDLFSGLND